MSTSSSLALEARTGLPDALRILLAAYPREVWTQHKNFDGLTRFWLDRHLDFRRGVEILVTDAEAALDKRLDPGQAVSRAAHVTQFLIEALHAHHHIEDNEFFPILSDAEPRLSKGFDLLEADHQALDRHLDDLKTGTNRLIETHQAETDLIATVDAFLGTARGFTKFLDRHLTDEEELVVPVILEYAPGR